MNRTPIIDVKDERFLPPSNFVAPTKITNEFGSASFASSIASLMAASEYPPAEIHKKLEQLQANIEQHQHRILVENEILKESFNAIFEHSPAAIVIIDRKRRIVKMNEHFARLSGYDPAVARPLLVFT